MPVIGIFDSGVGGLSVYREVSSLIPEASFIYYSDNAFCPYGDKKPEEIKDRARTITRLLLSRGADIIIVACNTATAAAISTLRAEFDVPFVGMEPAVKPAALGTRSGVIGVLATAGTLKGSLYLDTKDRFKDGVRIVEHVGVGFVQLVESGELSGGHARGIVAESLCPLLDEGADTIVLGCTHYPFLLPLMSEIAASRGDIRFIDPAPAVAKRAKDLLERAGKLGASSDGSGTKPRTILLSSGPMESLMRTFNNVLAGHQK